MQNCPNCGYTNRPGVVFCENCGSSLLGAGVVAETRSLSEADKADEKALPKEVTLEEIQASEVVKGTDDFPEGGLLRLEFGEGAKPVLMPINKTLVFGRRDAATGSMPDVDLTTFAGYRMGVSRRHAELRLDADGKHLNLWDLGSSNGTFINSDRLISHRPYRLRDGDQVRFGQLVMHVHFQKKGTAVPTPASEKPAIPAPAEPPAPATQLAPPKREEAAAPASAEPAAPAVPATATASAPAPAPSGTAPLESAPPQPSAPAPAGTAPLESAPTAPPSADAGTPSEPTASADSKPASTHPTSSDSA